MEALVVTELAWQKIEERLVKSGHKSLRVGMNSRGCGGSSYVYEPTNDDPKPNEQVIIGKSHQVIIDSKAGVFIFGSTLDWVVKDQFGQGFDIVGNTREISRCGCGESIVLN